jgi:hypothetical protein
LIPLLTKDNLKTMLKSTASALIFSASLFVALSGAARAEDVIVLPTFDASNQTSLPDLTDYEGVFYDGSSTFPPASIPIGTFDFTVPTGLQVTGATISGTFGDENIGVTALTDLFVLGGTIEVGECDDPSDDCATGANSLVPWSHTFSSAELTSLATDFSGGSIDFTAVQNSPFGAVVVGGPELDIQYSPEPASIFTLAVGLLAIPALRRRK